MKHYLAIPGALLLITAFIRSAVNVQWDTLNVGLAAAGALIVAAALVWNWSDVLEWLRDPRGVFAVTTGISVALFIAAIVMLNIAIWYNPWSVDLTASGRNQVTDETRAILARLDEPVTLRQFGRAAPQVEQLLRTFERESQRVRVEVLDPAREREQTVRYGVSREGTVVAIAGDAFRKIEEPNEQAVITAVLQVTSDEQPTACFVTGHGERGLPDEGAGGLAALAAILQASNYDAQPISLLQGDVPETCGALVIAGAREPWAPEELDRLAAYLDGGGRAALLLEPDPAPSFEGLLRPRGIDPGPGLILDASGQGQTVGLGPRSPVAIRYPDHPVTRGFAVFSTYEGARPLQIVEMPEFGGNPTALAETSPRSFATTRTDAIIAFDQARDRIGPLVLAAATTLRAGRRPDEETRLAVFGDSDFISNAGLRFNGNRDFFLRTLAWLLGEQEATIVAVDNRENRRILLTEQTRAWMYIVNLGVIPLIPLLAGVIVYLRSRR